MKKFRSQFRNKVIFFISMILVGVTVAVVTIGLRDRHLDLPEDIETVHQRLQSMKPGIKEGEVFSFLGLQEGIESIDSSIQGRTGYTWSRYNIGGGYILDIESQNKFDFSGYDFSFDEGLVKYAALKQNVSKDKDGVLKLKSLEPPWGVSDWWGP